MEYINSRKRLTVSRHILGNFWLLQYKVNTKLFGYIWVTVARCPVTYNLTVSKAVSYLESIREVDKWSRKGFELSYLEDAK